MVSIYDVAEKANVSISTVSRILNGGGNVAPATALAVEAAINELGYVVRSVRPGPVPQKRKGIKTGRIAFLSIGPYTPQQMYRMAAIPALLGGVHLGIERQGMELIMVHIPDGGDVPSVLDSRRIDGALLFGYGKLSPAQKNALRKIPTVCCFRNYIDPRGIFDQVIYDNSHVGQMAAEYLLDRGHRDIAFISPNSSHPAFIERRKEFCDVINPDKGSVAVIEGLPATDLMVIAQEADRLANELITLAPRPTGVFCTSDNLLLAVFNRLRQQGIEPGRDIELLGCNNDPQFMGQMHPRPATIDIKLSTIGERAVEQLFWRMAHLDDDSSMQVLVKPVIAPAENTTNPENTATVPGAIDFF